MGENARFSNLSKNVYIHIYVHTGRPPPPPPSRPRRSRPAAARRGPVALVLSPRWWGGGRQVSKCACKGSRRLVRFESTQHRSGAIHISTTHPSDQPTNQLTKKPLRALPPHNPPQKKTHRHTRETKKPKTRHAPECSLSRTPSSVRSCESWNLRSSCLDSTW